MFFFIFLAFPFLEIAVTATLAADLGFLRTLALLILDGLVGSFIIRYQGFKMVLAMRRAVADGTMPSHGVFDGFCMYAAGALFIFPGFASDGVALALLLPPVRRALERALHVRTGWSFAETRAEYDTPPGVIEGEYERVEDEQITDRRDE